LPFKNCHVIQLSSRNFNSFQISTKVHARNSI